MLYSMWCSATFYMTLLFQVASTNAVDKSRNTSENILAGAINNMTRVNRVIKELIQNYENLQKTHDSQKKSQNLYKIVKKRKDLQNKTVNEMIGSVEEERNIDKLSMNEKSIASIFLDLLDIKKPKEKQLELPPLFSTKGEEENEFKIKLKKGIKNIPKKINNATQRPEKRKTSTLKVRNKIKKKHSIRTRHRHTPRIKTSFSKNDIKNALRNKNENSNNFKKKHTPNIFPKKKADVKISLRSEKKHKNKNFQATDANNDENDFDFTREDETLSKEEFNTNALRKAYGNACLKLVIRKCYKACKAVLVTACRHHKCKEIFKDSYDRFSRTGCIKAFSSSNKTKGNSSGSNEKSNENTTKSSNEKSKTPLKNDSKKTSSSDESSDKDATRRKLRDVNPRIKTDKTINRDLATFCELQSKKKTSVFNKQSNEKYLNNLRTAYEKGCIKTSQERCNDACTYSYQKACEDYECNENKKNVFRKTCKRQCRAEFRKRNRKEENVKTGSSSASSSSSESSSSESSSSKSSSSKSSSSKSSKSST